MKSNCDGPAPFTLSFPSKYEESNEQMSTDWQLFLHFLLHLVSSDTTPSALGVILRSLVDACGEDFVGLFTKLFFSF